MNILITGATGFLGKRLCELLDKTQFNIIATGRSIHIGKELQQQGLCFVDGDLCDAEFVENITQGCTTIIHCAALSTTWASYNAFYQANVLATKNLIEAARKHKVSRFIHISTPSVYVGSGIKKEITEQTKLPDTAANYYIQTKKMAEELVLEAAHQGIFQAIILRPQGIFGPNDPTIIPRLLAASDRGGIPLINSGQHQIDITYIDNVCDAIHLSLRSKEASNASIYNISNGEPLIFVDLLEKIFTSIQYPLRYTPRPYWLLKLMAHAYEISYKLLGITKEPPLTSYTLSIMSESRTLDISAAQEKLGYKPIVSLDEGIARYAQWYKSQQNLVKS